MLTDKYPKGHIANPFDNIYDAIECLKVIEKRAYKADGIMQSIANGEETFLAPKALLQSTWLHPLAAHVKNDYPKHSFVVNRMSPNIHNSPSNPYYSHGAYLSFKPNLYKQKFLYRGQNDYYPGVPCVPSLYRCEEHNRARYYLDFLIFAQELEVLMRSHPLAKLLDSGIVLQRNLFKIRMHYTGLAQHYYNRSAFLDLTSDIDVMKFFATTEYDSKTDTYSPCRDRSKVGVIYLYKLIFPFAFQSIPGRGYALKTIGKQIFMRSGAQSGFLLQMNLGVDFKRLPEVSALYFKHDPKVSEEIFKASHEGHDYFAEDILEHAWYDRMKGRFESRVVSRKAVEHNHLFNEKEAFESLEKRLNERGITVDDYDPQFTDEELDLYYQSIKNGWWERFCDDIYFPGDNGEKYRKEMRNILNRSEYRWAFEKR